MKLELVGEGKTQLTSYEKGSRTDFLQVQGRVMGTPILPELRARSSSGTNGRKCLELSRDEMEGT